VPLASGLHTISRGVLSNGKDKFQNCYIYGYAGEAIAFIKDFHKAVQYDGAGGWASRFRRRYKNGVEDPEPPDLERAQERGKELSIGTYWLGPKSPEIVQKTLSDALRQQNQAAAAAAVENMNKKLCVIRGDGELSLRDKTLTPYKKIIESVAETMGFKVKVIEAQSAV
jgi:hypothetical protein